MSARILETGYARNQRLVAGREHRLGHRQPGTAGSIQRAWMRSPGHKANILRRQFREIGIGIAIGAPAPAGGLEGATYTTDFGVRR